MDIQNLTKTEKSLLLYLETCAVDQGGRVEMRRMNQDDRVAADDFMLEGLIHFERIPSEFITNNNTHYVEFLPKGWEMVHALRQARAKRSTSLSEIRRALVEMGKLEA